MKKDVLIFLLAISLYSVTAEENIYKSRNHGKNVTGIMTGTGGNGYAPGLPASVIIISRKDLEGLSVPEALSAFAGIQSYGMNNPDTASSSITRGFSDYSYGRVLYMIDGIKINNPDMAPVNWLMIPEKSIERIEVVKGGWSSFHGNNAVAAVINIITEKPEKKISVAADGSFGSNSSHEGAVSASGANERGFLLFSAEREESDGWQQNTDYENTGFFTKGKLNISDRLSVNISGLYSNSEYGTPGGLSESLYEADPKQAANSEDFAGSKYSLIRLNTHYQLSERTDLFFDAYFSRNKRNSDSIAWSYFYDYETDYIKINPSLFIDMPGLLKGGSFNAGLDYFRENLNLKSYADQERTSKTEDNDIIRNTLSLYSAADAFITGDLQLFLSGRAELSKIKGDYADSQYNDDETYIPLSYGVGANWYFTDESKIFASWNYLFRYPFFDEQAQYLGFNNGFIDNLDYEKGNAFEAGLEYHSPEKIKCGISLFLMLMQDEIAYNSVTFKNENSDDTRHTGAEIFMKIFHTDMLSTGFNYCYVSAVYTEGEYKDNSIPQSPEHVFSIIPEFNAFDILSFKAELIFTGKMYEGGDFENKNRRMGAFGLINYIASFSQSAGNFDMNVYFRVDNILDIDDNPFISYTMYYPRPGREVKVGASLSY